MLISAELRRLTLGCLALGFAGPVPPRWLCAALEDGLAGVVLFGSNLRAEDELPALTEALRHAAGRDVVVGLDEEGGDVTRLDAAVGSRSPGAAALGYLDEPASTTAVYRALGARLATAGVTLALAPVADVNSDPRNPVIGVRSFAADPQVVARHVAAAVIGVQSVGVAACAKHFPGHGATVVDSHVGVAVVDRNRDVLDAVDLVPFRSAIAAGVRAIMTGHLRVPALDEAALATLSPVVSTDLLRGGLGFDGAVVTDALEMGAVAGTVGIADGFVAAVAAGADLVETGAGEYPQLVEQLPVAVAAALRAGTLDEGRLRQAAARAARLAVRPAPPGLLTEPAEVSARCLEVVGPLPVLRGLIVVECRPPNGVATGDLPWSFGSRLGVDTRRVDGTSDVAGIGQWAAGRPVVLGVRDPQRHRWQCDLAAGLSPALIVDVGWPSPLPGPVVRTRGVAPGLLQAAAEIVLAQVRA